MIFLAPCGHEGIPVTVNYVTCPLCDGKITPAPPVGTRTFTLHIIDTAQSKPLVSEWHITLKNDEKWHNTTLTLESSGMVCLCRWVWGPGWEFQSKDFIFEKPAHVEAGASIHFHLEVPPP